MEYSETKDNYLKKISTEAILSAPLYLLLAFLIIISFLTFPY